MVVRATVICDSCDRNFAQVLGEDGKWKWTCDAFPDKIPEPIISGYFDHRQWYGNESLKWELDPEKFSLLKLYEELKEAGVFSPVKTTPLNAKPARKPKRFQ
tara:strand:- start:60 stop:365 length:306 start_codon:yes stop_codon:yes gene_type:complete